MPGSPMHLHGCSYISRRRLIITGWIQSNRGDISVAIGITTGHHLLAAFCKCPFLGDAIFFDWRVRVTLRSIRPNLKGRSATIS